MQHCRLPVISGYLEQIPRVPVFGRH
jgi:hypothetical protein